MRVSSSTALVAALATLAIGSVLTAPAAGAGAADDVTISVLLSDLTQTKTNGLMFPLQVLVFSGSGIQQKITVRLALPAGLSWGRDAPDPTEGCTADTPTVCTATMEQNSAGTVGVGWIWDVVAAAPGFYEVTASVEPEQPDPNTSNNTATFRFEVVALASGGGGSGGGGGGSASAVASSVKVTPAKPGAGTTVVATVRVSAGGNPVRPNALTCAGSVGAMKLRGKPTATSGAARCAYHPPAAAKGKTLRGTVAFTARGSKFTRRFSVRLR